MYSLKGDNNLYILLEIPYIPMKFHSILDSLNLLSTYVPDTILNVLHESRTTSNLFIDNNFKRLSNLNNVGACESGAELEPWEQGWETSEVSPRALFASL